MQFNTHDPQVTEALKNALVYAKQGTVHARRALPGEVIHTHLSGGLHEATGLCRAYPNPTGEVIEIEASWGPQKGDAKCMIASLFNPENPSELVGTPYLIGADEFAATYKLR